MEEEEVIIDFCGDCAVPLPEGLGNQDEPQCPSCRTFVKERKDRIQGKFTATEAKRMFDFFE